MPAKKREEYSRLTVPWGQPANQVRSVPSASTCCLGGENKNKRAKDRMNGGNEPQQRQTSLRVDWSKETLHLKTWRISAKVSAETIQPAKRGEKFVNSGNIKKKVLPKPANTMRGK